MNLTTFFRRARKALVLGVGGGGDIVGTLPTARLLDDLGVPAVLGGLSWERFVHDPAPGTRRLEEVRNVRPLAETAWLAGADTETLAGVRFAETEVAALYGAETLMLDLSRGVAGTVDGLRSAIQALGADLLVGVDVGGDSLAEGGEPGLRSPLADAMMLAVLNELPDVASVWAVTGPGTDGELTPEELDRAIARVAAEGGLWGAWGVTPAVADELERLVTRVRTEASNLVLRAARGAHGSVAIRGGTRTVQVSAECSVTYYLDPAILRRITPLADAVRTSHSLDAANTALRERGVPTEYDFELEMQRRGLHDYPPNPGSSND